MICAGPAQHIRGDRAGIHRQGAPGPHQPLGPPASDLTPLLLRYLKSRSALGWKCSMADVCTRRKLRTGGGGVPLNTRTMPAGKVMVSSPVTRARQLGGGGVRRPGVGSRPCRHLILPSLLAPPQPAAPEPRRSSEALTVPSVLTPNVTRKKPHWA